MNSAADHPSNSEFRLRVIAGPNRGAEFALSTGDNSIGRDPGNTIRLNSKTVSRSHAIIAATGDPLQLSITDNKSSNGIVVNGEKVSIHDLYPGDTIAIGEFRLQLIELACNQPSLKGSEEQTLTRREPGAHPERESVVVRTPRSPATLFFLKIISFIAGLRWTTGALLAIVIAFAANHFIVIIPVTRFVSNHLAERTLEQARLITINLAEHNRTALQQQNLLLLDCKSVLSLPGVKKAFIIDSTMKISCPLQEQEYSRDALSHAAIAEGAATDNCASALENGSDTCSFLSPIQIRDEVGGESKIVGAARVLFAPAEAERSIETVGRMPNRFLVITGIIALCLFFALFYMTRKPVETLQEALYASMSGSFEPLRPVFSISQLNDLVLPINSVLERVQALNRNGGGKLPEGPQLASISFEQLSKGLSGFFFIISTDNRLLAITKELAELTGISMGSIAQPLGAAISDTELLTQLQDICEKAKNSTAESISSTLVINGNPYNANLMVVGSGATQMIFCHVM